MNLKEIVKQGTQLGINLKNMKKMDAIREIQKVENNPACYASDRVFECEEKKCLWRTDCKQAQKIRLNPAI